MTVSKDARLRPRVACGAAPGLWPEEKDHTSSARLGIDENRRD